MITKNRILFVVGILIVLIPFLGFPSAYKTFFIIVFGVAVIVLAFLYARGKRITQIQADSRRPEMTSEAYVQNEPMFSVPEQTTSDDRFTDLRAIRSRAKTVKNF